MNDPDIQNQHQLKMLIEPTIIQARVQNLAGEIAASHREFPLTLLGVMTGSLLFLADLMKNLQIPHQVGLLQASSYRGSATLPGSLQVPFDFLPDITGRRVILIDDILDTGQTLSTIVAELQTRNPASLETAVLLWKKSRTQFAIQPDYLGFEIEDRFVVGYGLDFNNDYRHLPAIYELNQTPESV